VSNDVLPPAVLDMIVNSAEWVTAIQESIVPLTELQVEIDSTITELGAFGEVMTESAATAGAAMDTAAESATLASDAMDMAAASSDTLAASQDAAAASSDAAAAAADALAASLDAAAVSADELAAAQDRAAASGDRSAAAAGSSGGALGLLHNKYVLAAAGIAGLDIASMKMATDFQTATTRLVTSAGETDNNLAQVRQGLLAMAGQVGDSAVELAKGMYLVESAGYHGADGLTVLKAAAQGAKDEGADLTTVANGVTDALVDYHLKASDAATVTSQLVTAVSFGKTNFQDFSASLSNVLPLASAVHLSLADVSGVLAEMTAHGMSAQRASMNEANAIRAMIAPTAKQTTEMEKLGISTQQLNQWMSQDGLSGTLEHLYEAADKGAASLGQTVPEALKSLTGNATALNVALMTTGENFSSTQAAIRGIGRASADASGNVKGFSEIQATFGQTMDRVKAAGESLAIKLGTALLPMLTKAASGVASFLTDASANLGNFASGVKNMVGSVNLSPVIGMFKQVADIISGKVIPIIKDAARVFGPVLGVAFGTAVVAVKGLLTVLNLVLTPLKGLFDFMAAHSTVFTALAVGIGAAVLAAKAWAVIAGIATIATDLWTLAQTALDIVMDANPIVLIILAIIALVAAFIYLWNNSAAFRKFWEGLWNGIKKAAEAVGHWFAGPFANFFKTAFNDVKHVVTSVVDWFKNLPGNIGKALSSLGSTLAKTAKDAWKNFTEGIKTGVKDTLNFLKNLPKEIGFAIGFVAGVIYKKAVEAWDNFTQGITDAFKDTVQWFRNLPNNIRNMLVSAASWLVSTGQNLIHGLENGITNAYNAVVNFFRNLPSNIGKFLTSAGNWLVTTGSNIISGLVSGITTAFNDVVTWFKNLPTNIAKFVASAGSWLINTGQNLISGFGRGVVAEWDGFVNWIKNVPNYILNALGDAGKWLLNVGEDIVRGLWNGIKNMMSWLWNQISSFASGIVSGFKSALGISSPSKVMADQVGQHVARGIAQGMINGLPAVHNAISSIRGALTGGSYGVPGTNGSLGVYGGGLANTGSGSGSGMLVIQNNISGTVVGETQLSDILRTQVLRYNQRNPTNGLSLFGRGNT
jgi:TP901 family phage tail tape measure protein